MERYSLLSPLCAGICLALYGGLVSAEPLTTLPESDTETQQQQKLLERDELTQTPKNNSTLSQVVKHQPRVGINESESALQGGDLAPEEISLSGARPHQTKYTIGGVGVNNITTHSSGVQSTGRLDSGHSSGYYLDTNLLESVEVMDHNISPEYNGFTGGVVNAEIRQPKEEFTIEYGVRMTDSRWNRHPNATGKDENFASDARYGDGRYQPEYQKLLHSLHMSGAINDQHRLGINLSHQDSAIPQQQGDVDQKLNNLFITHVWQGLNWKATSDFRYSGHTSNSFLNGFMHQVTYQPMSKSVSTHQGMGGSIKLEGQLDFGIWETTLAYDQLSDSRDSDADYLRTNFDFSTNPRVMEMVGGYGDLSQRQDSTQAKTVLRLNPFFWGGSRHSVDVGLNVAHHKATGEREEDFASFTYRKLPSGFETVTNMTHFKPGSYGASTQQYGLFVNDKLEWSKLTLNLGGRVDRMQLFKETVFSPRVSGSWHFAPDNRLTLGASRYYSDSLLGWAMEAEKDQYKTVSRNCTPNDGNWDSNDRDNYTCGIVTSYTATDLSSAKTPYSDELSASWLIGVGNFLIEPVYVYRQQRQGLSLYKNEMLNNLESNTHIYNLSIDTNTPYSLAGGYMRASFDIAYSKRQGHGGHNARVDDDNNLNTGDDTEWIMLDGELMRRNEMPTQGYQAPLKATLAWVNYWPAQNLTLNNRVNYRQGGKLAVMIMPETVDIDGVPTRIDTLESHKMDDLITWDMSVNWTPEMLGKHTTLGLSVTNLLDQSVKISTSGSHINNRPNMKDRYSKGREVWLNMTLRN